MGERERANVGRRYCSLLGGPTAATTPHTRPSGLLFLVARDLLRVRVPPSGRRALVPPSLKGQWAGGEGWWEGGTLWVPSSEKTDLSVLSAGLVLPAHRGRGPLS